MQVRDWISAGAGRWIAILGCGALLVGAVMWALRDPSSVEKRAILKRGRRVLFYCRACEATGMLKGVRFDDHGPYKCPQCGKKEAVMGIRCYNCGNVIERQNKPVYYCPCGFKYESIAGGGEPPAQ